MTSTAMSNVPTDVVTYWRTMVRTGANMLVIGSSDWLTAFGSTCGSEFRQPVACTSSATLELRGAATLVVVDGHLLDARRQQALGDWLSDSSNAETQVVTLAQMPVFPLVRAGQFDASLYYRLNTICIRLDGLDPRDLGVASKD